MTTTETSSLLSQVKIFLINFKNNSYKLKKFFQVSERIEDIRRLGAARQSVLRRQISNATSMNTTNSCRCLSYTTSLNGDDLSRRNSSSTTDSTPYKIIKQLSALNPTIKKPIQIVSPEKKNFDVNITQNNNDERISPTKKVCLL